MSVASIHADAQLEKRVLEALQAEPALRWAVVDILDAAMFTGAERQAAARACLEDLPAGAGEANADSRDEVTKQARQLGDLYQKRELVARLEPILIRIGREPAAAILEEIEGVVSTMQNVIREDRAGELAQATGLFPALVEDLRVRRAAVRAGASVGVPTGYTRLDALLGGLQTGQHILAAEPGAGKTTWALQTGGHAARNGFPVLFVSFEETVQRLALKALAQRAGLESKRYADGRAETRDVEAAVAQYGAEFEKLYFLEGNARTTTGQIKARALQIMNRWQAPRCLVIVDYLQRWAGMRREVTEYRLLVDRVSSELRELALRLDSPVLAICSQNRAGEGEARMNSLKESGNLEYGADSIMTLTKEGNAETPSARPLRLTLLKNRYGDRGEMALTFRPATGQFTEDEYSGRR